MKLIFGIFLSILGTLPLLVASNPLKSRATDGVWVCPEANWGGVCSWTPVNASTWSCNVVNTQLKAWSIGPDKDIACDVYQDSTCPESFDPHVVLSTSFPGIASLAGPAAQGGQGSANITTYKAYHCWPTLGKRSVDTDSKADAISITTVSTSEDPRLNARTIAPRGGLGLYTCSAPNYHDTCEWIPVTAKDESDALCLPLPFPESSSISFGPDEGVMCKVYNWSCFDDASSHDTTMMQHPGSSQLSKHSKSQSSGATTWKCWLM